MNYVEYLISKGRRREAYALIIKRKGVGGIVADILMGIVVAFIFFIFIAIVVSLYLLGTQPPI